LDNGFRGLSEDISVDAQTKAHNFPIYRNLLLNFLHLAGSSGLLLGATARHPSSENDSRLKEVGEWSEPTLRKNSLLYL